MSLGCLGVASDHAWQQAGAYASASDPRVTETLSAGIQDITNAMVEDFKLTDVLRMILETMFRALEFDRIIFCMRDAKTETMIGRFGLGEGVESHVKIFKMPLKATTPDLFGVVCNKGTDTMISDATEARITQRLPEWYRKGLCAPTFLLLPLLIKGAPFGLIYADKKTRGALELERKGAGLAAHLAQPGGDGVQAVHLKVFTIKSIATYAGITWATASFDSKAPGNRTYCAAQAPSIFQATPRTLLPAGEQKNTANAPNSSGVVNCSGGLLFAEQLLGGFLGC